MTMNLLTNNLPTFQGYWKYVLVRTIDIIISKTMLHNIKNTMHDMIFLETSCVLLV